MSQESKHVVMIDSSVCLQHLDELDNDPILAENIMEYLNEVTCNNSSKRSNYIVCFTTGEKGKPHTFALEGLIGYILSHYKAPTSDQPNGKFNKKFKYPITTDYYFQDNMFELVLQKAAELNTLDSNFMKEYLQSMNVSSFNELLEKIKQASTEYGNAEFSLRSAALDDDAYFTEMMLRRRRVNTNAPSYNQVLNAAVRARQSFQMEEEIPNSPPRAYVRRRRSACPSPASTPTAPRSNTFNVGSPQNQIPVFDRMQTGGLSRKQRK